MRGHSPSVQPCAMGAHRVQGSRVTSFLRIKLAPPPSHFPPVVKERRSLFGALLGYAEGFFLHSLTGLQEGASSWSSLP